MSSTPDRIARAGDVRINDVTIVTSTGFAQTITPQVIAVEIYEDIFAPFVTGKLLVKDCQELTNLLPLVGEETLRLSVITPTLERKFGFESEYYIHKMDDRQRVGNSELIYVLHFISKEAIVDLNAKLSRAYSGKISDIVTNILAGTNGLGSPKKLNVETTNNATKFVANFWSPTQCIEFLANQAVNDKQSPTYLFFENKYGLNFVSLDSLYRNTPVHQRFIWDNYSAEAGRMGGSLMSIERDYQRVLELDINEGFNYMQRLKSGMYGSEIVYYDILAKQYVYKSYVPQFSREAHLNKFPVYTNRIAARPKSTLIHEHQYYNNFDGYDVTSNTKVTQQRRAKIAEAEAYKLTITVFGRTDYTAGQRVYLNVPKATQFNPNDSPDTYEDKIMSGEYLIGAVCHQITRQSHECVMELIKDSMMVNLNEPK